MNRSLIFFFVLFKKKYYHAIKTFPMNRSIKSKTPFIFVNNIKDPLAVTGNPCPGLMESFLLSETYSTSGNISLAKNNGLAGCLIVSDNGNFSRMKKIAGAFSGRGAAILADALKENGRSGSVSTGTMEKRNALINEMLEVIKTEQEKMDISRITKRQLACLPDYMIGMEDITIPVLHMCDMLDPVFQPSSRSVRRFQKNTKILFDQQQQGEYGFEQELKKVFRFRVFHAFDYKSARQASILNSAVQTGGIAISFGATLLSKKYLASLSIGRKKYCFDDCLPESYLLSVALMLGSCSSNSNKLPVHILGAGTPILVVLLAMFMGKTRAISIDSTAPFKDAEDGKMYGNQFAYLKMSMYKVAASALLNNEEYQSDSPWFKWFNEKYPPDWNGLQKELNIDALRDAQQLQTETREDVVNILASRLEKSPRLLEKYIPFFSKLRGGKDELIKDVRMARAGCNYWVLKDICREVRKRKNNMPSLCKWVETEVSRYEQVANLRWANAVRACLNIIQDQLKYH